MVGRHFGWLLAGSEVGVRWTPSGASGNEVADDMGNHFQLAGVLSAGDASGLRAEASARTTLSFVGRRGPVEVLGGLRYNIGWMEVFALAGPSLGGVTTNPSGLPEFRVMTGVSLGNAAGLAGMEPGPASGVGPVAGGDTP
jgi:hypothetical protein